ncbi:hypothetical protein [Bifidobacterium criceti]|uniref:Uncharacterized protein n=1 Tax=Bifidobacterium criceti TaxID=1960969 RepID=A0A2A2EEL6_9BIFI|nr:hypothetical protein [Bifidobacterium criceti]PAU67382.1 hypothetical protein B1526_1105 [Bifidobacterium criceti]
MISLNVTCVDTHALTITPDNTQTQDDGDFIDTIGPLFDNDDGPHDESCNYLYGTCDDVATFSITNIDFDGMANTRFYCPKHFLLCLHFIIDATTSDNWFSQLDTQEERAAAFRTYYASAQRIRG